jgi:hypothetical protein
MSCEELRGQYDLYALGVADDAAAGDIADHLGRQCPACVAGVREARRLAALLGAVPALEGPAPPRRLRARIVAATGAEVRRFPWSLAWAMAATLFLFAAVYFNGRERQYTEEAVRLRQQLGRQTVTLERLNETMAILHAPDTTEVSFGQGQPRPPKGRVFLNPRRGVVLIASNLPPTGPGKIYEMWVIPQGQKPVPAGLFQSDPDGTAIHLRPGAVPSPGGSAIAVTLENEGGADQPTSTPLFVAAIPPVAP